MTKLFRDQTVFETGNKFQNLANEEISRYICHFQGGIEFRLRDAFENYFPQDNFHKELFEQLRQVSLQNARKNWGLQTLQMTGIQPVVYSYS